MRFIILFLFSISTTINIVQAQVGIGTNSPNPHAVLDLHSPGNNQGLLVPSLTNAQRTATSLTSSLSTSDNGLLVYDTDDKKFYFWKDAVWQPVLDGTSSTGGSVTSVTTGTGLTGGPITSTGTISLANTSVAAGTYGSATQATQFTVDAQGRITDVSNVAITGVSPSGAAGGDLGGTFPNPIIASLRGNPLSATVPATNQILKWNGTSWVPSADADSGGTVTSVTSGTGLSGGPITGIGTISLANTTVTPATYGDATHVAQVAVDAQGRITTASNVQITGAAPTGAAGGDLTGNFPNPTIATNAVTDTKIASGVTVSKLSPSGTNGQVLTTVAGATAWAALPASGTVTSIATGTGLAGGPITGTGTISLANTTVTPNTYGDGTHVAQVLVDAQGRITNASSVLITGAAPTGVAGGDLTGTFPNPTVSKLQGSAVSSTAPSTNQILKWNGTSWLPSADANSGGTVTNIATSARFTGGPFTTTGTLDLATSGVTAATYGSATQVAQFIVDAYGRVTTAANVTITGVAPGGSASGDLTGTYPGPTIAANAVTAAKIAAGDYSSKINTGTYSISITGNSLTSTTATNFSGALAGDVTGTQSATLVSKLQGNAVSSTAPTANQILKWNGTSWLPSADANSGGTVTSITTSARLTGGPITTTGALDLATSGVTASTYGSTTQVGQFVVDAYGRITSAGNVTIAGVTPAGPASGDLTGTYPSPTIAAASGNNLVSAVNNGATTGTINVNRLNAGVVVDTESPAAGDISGDFAAGLQLNANSVTGAEILDGTIATVDVANASITDPKIATGITVSKLSPSATNGQVLTTVAGASAWATIPAVTNVATGTGLTGGPITATGTISLANTTVTPNTYGDGTHVPQIIVDAQGRITTASSILISGSPPTGTASGDLTGSYPAPAVAATSGNNLIAAINNGATTSTINTNRLNTGVVLDTDTPAAGDISGTFAAGLQLNANSVTTAEILDGTIATIDLANTAVTDAKVASGITASKLGPSATNGYVLTTVAGATAWAALPTSVTSVGTGTGLTGGPITGSGTISLANTTVTPATYGDATHVSQIVVDAQGRITTASSVAITGGSPTGAAGGDLTGTYPNPTIAAGAVTTNSLLDGTIADVDISTTAGIQDSKLATISTAGKVSGNAITTGTIGGNTAINTTGSIQSLKSISASNGIPGGVVSGSNTSTGSGVSGVSTNTTAGYGVFGQGTGVTIGRNTTYSYGVYGTNTFSTAFGYLGGQYGVYGNFPGDWAIVGTGDHGVHAIGTTIGVYGNGNGAATSYGVYGEVFGNASYGVYGFANGVGSFGVYSNGPASGTTAWLGISDRRYKKNVSTLTSALTKILRLRGVNFDWRSDEFPKMNFEDKRQIGFIAQEIKEVLPEVVTQDSKGYFAVGYDRVVPVLVEAMREQQKIIDEQKSKIEELEKRESEFASRLSSIEALLQNRASSTSLNTDKK